jgi:methyltransferase (TIGR00027 family)
MIAGPARLGEPAGGAGLLLTYTGTQLHGEATGERIMDEGKQARDAAPDGTSVRVALWRAMHVLADAPPHVFDDTLGLRLIAPDADWRSRPDIGGEGIRGYRASIVARARFIEDQVEAAVAAGVAQYVILGAGLDTFAQRRPALRDRLRVFEIDRPGPQAWKQRRLDETGLGGANVRFVPVDFESGASWWAALTAAGFDPGRPAVVASTGVSMYLTREANRATLEQLAALAPGSTLAMTFIVPLDLVDPAERAQHEAMYARARAAGTPFQSLFRPDEIVALAREAGFARVRHFATADLAERYFAGRNDGLTPASGEMFLVADV